MTLELFPTGALNGSVITTVWIGVAVVCTLNLRFGLTMSGLVIPGYLVPLLLSRPMSAVVIVGEGLITYWITLLLIDKLFQRVGSSEMFGRDRFFALVLVSVIVRVVADGFLLPTLGSWLNQRGFVFDYHANLHSFGLVIVALVANQMWNGGVRRGMTALVLYTGISFLIVRYGLMVFTNFSISNLAFIYEDIASDVLASPKAYIILLTTAYIASRMNLKYGWDFSGILIPALLALQWYQPLKLAMTILEALVILLGARLALKVSFIARMNMEGARLLLLFFNIGFGYKILLAYLLIWFAPDLKVSDYYAFGFLLSTLLALKMFQKGIALRMTRAVVELSLAGVLAASLLGFALVKLSPGELARLASAEPDSTIAGGLTQTTNIVARVNHVRTASYESKPGGGVAPSPLEIDRFDQALVYLREYRSEAEQNQIDHAAALLTELGFNLEWIDQQYLLFYDAHPRRGWGIYLLNLRAQKLLLLEVPAAMDERGSSEVALALLIEQDYAGLALAGTRREDQTAVEATGNPIALFQRFHQAFGSAGALQLRATDRELGESVAAELWIKRRVPDDLAFDQLESLIGNIEVIWGERPYPNRQREVMRDRFVEIVLSRQAVRSLLAHSTLSTEVRQQIDDTRIDGYLNQWLTASKTQLAQRNSGLYRPPSLGELLYLEAEVIEPLLSVLGAQSQLDQGAAQELRQIAAAAGVLNLELIGYRHRRSGKEYLILAEPRASGPNRYWGTYVFRLGRSTDFVVEVPRPLAELRSFEYGATLFERLDAGVLLIAGAHPEANPDGAADVLRKDNKVSLFNQVHQSLLKSRWRPRHLVLQVRAYTPAPEQADATDIIVSYWQGRPEPIVADLAELLEQTLGSDGSSIAIASGRAQTSGYDVRGNAQTSFLRFVDSADMAVLWLSSVLRRDYRQRAAGTAEQDKFEALGIRTYEGDLIGLLGDRSFGELPTAWPILAARLDRFIATRDIVSLALAYSEAANLKWLRVLDASTSQAFMVVQDNANQIAFVCNLQPRQHIDHTPGAVALSAAMVEQFVTQRARCLRPGASP